MRYLCFVLLLLVFGPRSHAQINTTDLNKPRNKPAPRPTTRPATRPTTHPAARSATRFSPHIPDIEFVRIPAGSFMMGSEDGNSYEKPVHRVNITRDFYMGKYEVTQAQWKAVMGTNPSYFKGDNLPVERVSWNDAQEFIRKLNALASTNKYRLPTEAEWEYAARAGSSTKWSFGNDISQLDNYAWYGANSGNRTHEVGGKLPNAWGLYDMHGNVWEWCADYWDEKYYAKSPLSDPKNTISSSTYLLRGGSWLIDASNLRSTLRDYDTPSFRHDSNGFRVSIIL